MNTILASTPVDLTPAVVLNFDHFYTTPASRDEEPKLTEAWYDNGREASRSRQVFSAEHQAAFAQYQRDHKAWEECMVKRGKKCVPETVYDLKEKGYQVLIDYLKATGAPAEILTIAEGYKHLTWLYLNYSRTWRAMPDWAYKIVGQYVGPMRQAIKLMRECLNVARGK